MKILELYVQRSYEITTATVVHDDGTWWLIVNFGLQHVVIFLIIHGPMKNL